MKPFDLPVS